ncbi:MAG: alanine racemase [Actinobacteria bacterium]|nr:alanine racemase [Actinomycetota bacterium]
MTIQLTVHEARWLAHVQSVARSTPGLVPVVKGNAYGFRRWNLMPLAGQLSREIAVGTVFEVRDIPAGATPIVLTPTLMPPPRSVPLDTVLTVSNIEHVRTLATNGWGGSVIVKLRSSTMRYGIGQDGLDGLLRALDDARLTVRGWSVHPPLEGDMALHLRDITEWLDRIDPTLPVYVSHLDDDAYAKLRRDNPGNDFRMRLGTRLWLGDKSIMKLGADVVDRLPVEAGSKAGYRLVPVSGPGEIVMVGCGTAHGVGLLPDGRSPFHYREQRLNLLEPPHMHTSMLYVARGRPTPEIGEWIDVQQPLTRVQVDLLQWVK